MFYLKIRVEVVVSHSLNEYHEMEPRRAQNSLSQGNDAHEQARGHKRHRNSVNVYLR